MGLRSIGLNPLHIYNSFLFRDPKIFTACAINIKLSNTTNLPHPIGIVVGRGVTMGENVSISQNVTIGSRAGGRPRKQPTIQDDVKIKSGAVVIGDITLHTGSVVGANAVVLDDVAKGKTVVGAPAKEVGV